jgi:hypothetical protein
MRLEGLGKLKKKSSDLIENRTRDLSACGIAPQLNKPQHAPIVLVDMKSYISSQMGNIA